MGQAQGVCVCVCVRACLCVRVCVRACVRVCVCVCTLNAKSDQSNSVLSLWLLRAVCVCTHASLSVSCGIVEWQSCEASAHWFLAGDVWDCSFSTRDNTFLRSLHTASTSTISTVGPSTTV